MAQHLLAESYAALTTIEQFAREVHAMHRALDIPPSYAVECNLPLCIEPDELVDTELDFYQRPQRLTAEAFSAWTAMKSAAASEGVTLFLISAFRGLDYQRGLIEKKLSDGWTLEEILQVNAAPGYSEHHTGRAIDLGTPNCDALIENFENTAAFQWLTTNANTFKFFMSYPRVNTCGIQYEPWHWCFSAE